QMTHLSDGQKQSISGEIDRGREVSGVESVKEKGRNVDNAMNEVGNSIGNKDEVKGSERYVDGDRDKENG
ncbi:hypothetical protein, partial [Staphylococcus aureus]|uniref:hypothetical protein n=1 Tax=Staphylococcus aureus TaxID=1280 RepID=UPI001642CBD0